VSRESGRAASGDRAGAASPVRVASDDPAGAAARAPDRAACR